MKKIRIMTLLVAVTIGMVSTIVLSETGDVGPNKKMCTDERGLRHIYLRRAQGYDVYEAYREAVSQKLERLGNLNLPPNLTRSRNPLLLTLDIAINADGSVCSISVVSSSGNDEFDKAAVSIIFDSAPYPEFPDSVRHNADVVHLKYTWKFSQPE